MSSDYQIKVQGQSTEAVLFAVREAIPAARRKPHISRPVVESTMTYCDQNSERLIALCGGDYSPIETAQREALALAKQRTGFFAGLFWGWLIKAIVYAVVEWYFSD